MNNLMDLKKLAEEQSLTNFPVGLGGCRATNSFFDSCEYDVTIFDDKYEMYFKDLFNVCINDGVTVGPIGPKFLVWGKRGWSHEFSKLGRW